MTESFSKNFIDYEEYPQSADIQNRCVSMIGRLFNAPFDHSGAAAVGTSTVGSSEAIMLAVLAMKKRWQNARKSAGKPWDKPNMYFSFQAVLLEAPDLYSQHHEFCCASLLGGEFVLKYILSDTILTWNLRKPQGIYLVPLNM